MVTVSEHQSILDMMITAVVTETVSPQQNAIKTSESLQAEQLMRIRVLFTELCRLVEALSPSEPTLTSNEPTLTSNDPKTLAQTRQEKQINVNSIQAIGLELIRYASLSKELAGEVFFGLQDDTLLNEGRVANGGRQLFDKINEVLLTVGKIHDPWAFFKHFYQESTLVDQLHQSHK